VRGIIPWGALLVLAGSLSAATIAQTSDRGTGGGSVAADVCARLAGIALMGGATTSASFERAQAVPQEAVSSLFGPFARPDHCLVRGVLNRRTGVDGKQYEIRVELRVPGEWNGKLLYFGGIGVDGVIFPADGPLVVGKPGETALQRGFAVVSTDSGHQAEKGPADGDYLFGVDPQARDEYGDQQLPLVHSAAIRILTSAFGRVPSRSYFYGISNGGRQAMMAAQRHPDLFDGIVALSPGFRLVQASLDGSIYHAQLAARVAAKMADGTPDIDHPLSDTKLKLVSDRILEACDGLDGVQDGMVFKSLSCRVDPMKWVCSSGASDNCLTAAEARYVRDFMAGGKLRDGRSVYSRVAADPQITAGMNGRFFSIFWGEVSHIYTTPPTVSPDMRSYLFSSNLDTEYQKTLTSAGSYKRSGVEFTNSDSPNMDAFMRHGGKLIIYAGAADQAFPSPDAAAYMDTVFARYGKARADDFVRLFIVPGWGHVLPDTNSVMQTDLLEVITQWVERERAPEYVMASARSNSAWPGRTRPICTYPQVTIYKGSGSIEDGTNFTCK
jgi:pimeloyl-ACP methyl ester carboxylesterase